MPRERHSVILAFLLLFFGGWCVQGRCDDLEGRAAAIAAQSQARIEEFRGIAETITRQHQRQVENQVRQLVPENDQILPERTIIFITLGETPADTVEKNRQLLKDIKAMSPQAIVAIRGLPAGQRSLEQFARYLKNFQEHGDLPSLRLDPNLFREFQVTVAPTMILERQGQKVAEVRGLVNAVWLKRQVETGRRGDLGQMGPTMQIAERDLIEELQERLMTVDWEAKKKQAYARYWQQYRFTELPEATRDRRFTLDAKYTVDRDYILPDGKVIARKGEVKDLFKILTPRFALVIFDGTKPKHVAWAKKTAQEYQGKLRVKLLATKLPDLEDGWKALANLEEQLHGPVYLLNDQLRDRFQIQHIPALVLPAQGHFEINEFSLAAAEGPDDQGGKKH